MRKYLNEKGSLPLVLLIVLIVSISIATLANLMLTEKVNTKLTVTNNVAQAYEKDSVIEVTRNITKQLFLSKEWEEIDGAEIINDSDLFTIEEAINAEVLPPLGISSHIVLEESYFPPNVDYYCQKIEEESEELLTYDCMEEKLTVELKLIIEKEGEVEVVILKFDNLLLKTTDIGDKVFIEME